MLPRINRIKGIALVVIGALFYVYIVVFDRLMARDTIFGTKAIAGFLIGGITIVNGIRIFNRK